VVGFESTAVMQSSLLNFSGLDVVTVCCCVFVVQLLLRLLRYHRLAQRAMIPEERAVLRRLNGSLAAAGALPDRKAKREHPRAC